jgi:hypothetical protein
MIETCFGHVMSQYNELMGIFREYTSLDDGDCAISAIETVQSFRDSKPHKGADPEGTLSEFLADMTGQRVLTRCTCRVF